MALIACPECNTQVSDTAFKCTSCGYTIKKPKRGFFGKTFKWLFILFNILIVIWLFSAIGGTADVVNTATSEAEKAGAAVGTAIGMSMLLMFWAVGDVILGALVLFTRPKS